MFNLAQTCILRLSGGHFIHDGKWSHCNWSHLNAVRDASAVHTARNIYSVAPDVILWLSGSNHTSHYWTNV